MRKLLCFMFVILLFSSGCSTNSKNILNSKAFFVKQNNKYYLYSIEGNKLNDSWYDDITEFNGKYAIVKKDNKYAIINDNGKITVNFGEYDKIQIVSKLFKVSKNNKEYLIDGTNNVIAILDEIELSYNDTITDIFKLEDKKNKKIEFRNSLGQLILNIPYNDKKITATQKDNYIMLYNNENNYLLDIKENKKIIEFKTKKDFCIESISKDKTKILLKTCKNNSSSEYRIVDNGKLLNINNECKNVKIDDNVIICNETSNEYILHDNKKITDITNDMTYSDNLGYVKNNEKSGVDFYKLDKLVKYVDCVSLVNYGKKDGLILLKDSCNNDINYVLYDENGNKISSIDTKNISNKDINGNYLVENNKYYLINNKGNKITDDFELIETYDGYYIVVNNGLRGILNNSGNKIIDTIYESIELFDFNNKKYALLILKDGKNIIYNITDNKQIHSTKNKILNEKNYFSINYYSNKYYYSYINGKMFYKEEL